MLNRPSGNMYSWAHTWNPLRGSCIHRCIYCYVTEMKRIGNIKKKYTGKPEIDEKTLRDNLYVYGAGVTKDEKPIVIFVGSMVDLFASNVPGGMIRRILKHCNEYPLNTYLFQTKNPERFTEFLGLYPPKTILGTTIETCDSEPELSRAPIPTYRMYEMTRLRHYYSEEFGFKIMINIEPAVDFEKPDLFVSWLAEVEPDFISIGADSKESELKEPSGEKLLKFISRIEEICEVRKKDNLERILKDDESPIAGPLITTKGIGELKNIPLRNTSNIVDSKKED